MFAASKTASVSGGYQISRSLRFNSADSAYLSRTPASAGNRQTWTWSGWVKRSELGTSQYFFSAYTAASDTGFFGIRFVDTSNFIQITGGITPWRTTTQVFRDPSAWYHVVVVLDTTQATADNRVRLYINGVEVTDFGVKNNPSQNADLGINGNWAHSISSNTLTPNQFFNGYMTEVNFIDGQALTPSSFGETNAQTGVWQPKAYSGSYGTNGFYLNFSDNSNTTAATLGKDYSGNGNNWTPNNFSVTAGSGNDSMVDSPTAYGFDTGVGGEVRGNYSTINPIDGVGFSAANGNLDVTVSSATGAALSTISMSSGKWYWEVVGTGGGAAYMVGVANASSAATTKSWQGANGWYYYGVNGQKYTNGSGTSYGSTYTTGVVIGVALDMDAGTVTFYRNGVSQGTAYSSFSGLTMQPSVSSATGNEQYSINFGQRPFAYTAPSGYKALCTQNLPTPTIGATSTTLATSYFNPVLYTGTGATRTVTGVNFSPDLVWIKSRSAAYNNRLYDRLRGVENVIQSNSTAAEASDGTGLTAFGSDGFTLGSSVSQNESGSTFVSWNWKANGSGSTNTAGSITSTVSANTTSGFSVVTYSGNGSNSTVGHGLGVAPKFIILKQRNQVDNWLVYSEAIGAGNFLRLNTDGASTSGSPWQSTTPTSSVVYLGSGSTSQSGTDYVMYCFASIAGYSAFGSYTANGSTDGPFVFTGFRPAWILFKGAVAGSNWFLFDSKRSTYNAVGNLLYPNGANAENTVGTYLDFLSNGFKIRTASGDMNSSGTYTYAAFAENPFKTSLAR